MVSLCLEDRPPIVLHANYCPAALWSFRQGFDQLAATLRVCVIGVFAHRVGVMDDQTKTCTGIPDGRVFEHFLVAIAVTESHHRTASNDLMDSDRLAGLVVHEDILECLEQDRLAVAHLEFYPAVRSYDLLGRYAVDSLRPDSHEVGSAAGDNEGLESVSSQISQHFVHWLVDASVVGLAKTWMLRRLHPDVDSLVELVSRHPGMSQPDDVEEPLVVVGEESLVVTGERGRDEGIVLQLDRRHDVHDVGELRADGFVWPDTLGPGDDHRIARAAKVRGDELGGLERRAARPGPAGVIHVVGLGGTQGGETADLFQCGKLLLDGVGNVVLGEQFADRTLLALRRSNRCRPRCRRSACSHAGRVFSKPSTSRPTCASVCSTNPANNSMPRR